MLQPPCSLDRAWWASHSLCTLRGPTPARRQSLWQSILVARRLWPWANSAASYLYVIASLLCSLFIAHRESGPWHTGPERHCAPSSPQELISSFGGPQHILMLQRTSKQIWLPSWPHRGTPLMALCQTSLPATQLCRPVYAVSIALVRISNGPPLSRVAPYTPSCRPTRAPSAEQRVYPGRSLLKWLSF